MKFQHGEHCEWRFRARLEFQQPDGPECVAVVGYKLGDPTSLTVDLEWLCSPQEAGAISRKLAYWDRNHIWLISKSDHSPSIELLGITGHSHTQTRITVQAAAVEIGVSKSAEACDHDLMLSVQLQPSGILTLPEIHHHFFTGEIRIERVESGAAFVACSLGNLEASREFRFVDGETHGDNTTSRIQRAVIRGDLVLQSGTSLACIHEQIQKQVDSICQALSLAYRQPVEPYQYSYISNPSSTASTRRIEAVARRMRPAALRNRKGDELINMRALCDGGLERLVSALRGCRPDLIGPVIRNIAASFMTTADVGYFMVFAALEALMEECNPAQQIPSREWKKIENQLRKAIEAHVPSDYRSSAKSMLPALRRASLFDRVCSNVGRFNPRTDDLWPRAGFEAGMRGAIAARNGLVHAGEVNEEIGRDLVRVRTFVERLLLRHIRWSDEHVWNWYDQDLKWVNSGQ